MDGTCTMSASSSRRTSPRAWTRRRSSSIFSRTKSRRRPCRGPGHRQPPTRIRWCRAAARIMARCGTDQVAGSVNARIDAHSISEGSCLRSRLRAPERRRARPASATPGHAASPFACAQPLADRRHQVVVRELIVPRILGYRRRIRRDHRREQARSRSRGSGRPLNRPGSSR